MTPLALTGSASAVSGARQSKRRMVLRLCAPRSNAAAEIDDRDAALIRDEADLAATRRRGFKTAVFLEGGLSPGAADGFESRSGSGRVSGIWATATSLAWIPVRGGCACCTGGPRNTARS